MAVVTTVSRSSLEMKMSSLKQCRPTAGGDSGQLTSLGTSKIRQAIYELCLHVVHGRLKQDHAVNALGDLQDQLQDVTSFVSDVLGLIDVELIATDEEKATRERFISLVAAFSQATGAEGLLKSRLDLDLLENASLVQSKQLFQQKYVKIKTRLYYKQQKFNLLREESEGYSKLITELNQEISEKLTPEQMLQNIKSLIGCFNLDPNRVIDILLESFEMRPDLETYYVPLIKSYVSDKTTLCHVLGFKFQFYKNDETPSSLYKLAALLLKNDLVELDGLYHHLHPSDSSIIDYSKKEMSDAKQYARKLLVVSLSDKGGEEKKKEEDTVKIDLHENNQKLGLVEALLGIGAWEKSKSILDRLPEFFGTTHKPIARSLCALIHTVMDPVYRKHNGLSPKVILKKNKHEMAGCNVEKAFTFKDVYTHVYPMVTYLGPYAHCDPVLLIKLIRIGKTYMKMKNSLSLSTEDNTTYYSLLSILAEKNSLSLSTEDNIMYYGLLSILDEVVLPAMSFLSCNCCISEELWVLMKLLPYELRYRMYGNWKNETYMHHPALIRVRADTLERSKYIMKRLSKENVKPSGRQLGKLSHSNPGVLFEYVLKQIEKYDNLIGPVVDSLKYLTNFSYDILVFCIMEAVAGPEKEKMKFDDTSLSLWLQSLANFAGSICKKYNVELAGMMQYVTNQLKAGKSIDLLLMREIVQKMAGIEISEEITEDQLEAMSGGELLKQEGGYFSQVRNTKKSSTRLKDTVLEHDLALSLCLLISQQRDAVIYKEGTQRHLKLVGKLYDQCQDTLVQFGSFLSMQLSTEEFVRRLPAIDKMVSEYHVPADAAFFLSRSLYSYEINCKYEELRKAEKADKEKKLSSAVKIQKYVEAAEMVMDPVVECVRPLYPAKIWEDLSPTFYATFWSLAVYDINVPTVSYEKQVTQLQNQISSIEDSENMAQSKKKKDKDRCNQLMDKLKDEEKKQTDHVQRVMARLKNEKDRWFVSRSTKNETITQFLQLCIFPRCCFTASDASFCAKFIHILHNLKTPNFSTLICYDRIFCDITYTVSSCTENEAHRYGRFLSYALETVMRWHSSKNIYDKECGAYPGFVTVFRKGVDSNNKADQLDFENYRHVCHKWHFRITKAMVSCIESGNYIQIRNALIVLTKILASYPRIIQFGQALERRIDRLRQDEKDKRPDVYALAIGYSGMLKSKKTTWLPETEFHHRDKDNKKAQVNGPAAAAAKADTSTSDGKTKTTTKTTVKDKEAKLRLKTVEKKDKSEEKPKPITVIELKKQSDSDTSRSSSKERKEKKEEKARDKSAVSEKSEEKTKHKEKSASFVNDISVSKEVTNERSAKVKQVKVKEEVTEEKTPKEKANREHHEGKEPKEKKTHRDKQSREEAKAEKRAEKESKREEKHDRIKLKRSYTPDYEERDHHREREWEEARGSSVTSNGSHKSHTQPSPDESPRYVDDRDMKRRKTDPVPSTSKEDISGSSKSRHRRSLSPEKDRERERKEKKRAKREAAALSENDASRHDSPYDDQEYGGERESSPVKKRRSLEPPSGRSSKLNGDDSRHHHEDGYAKPSTSIKKEKKDGTPDTAHSRSKSKDDKKRDRSSSKKVRKE